MTNKDNKMIYCVSDVISGYIYIIDGERYNIIKKIEIGQRPQNIISDEKNYIYIASDRNNKITILNNSYDIDKILYIPNNGNIQIDSKDEKIYVSNADEVYIYSLKTEEKIGTIKGFMAADCLCLNINKKLLFVLDILQNEIKVYDTFSLKLIRVYKDIGNAPQFICIEEKNNYIYVANKCANKRKKIGDIAIIEINSGDIKWINLDSGSSITHMEQNKNFLYAVNSGLNRIDVIDISKMKIVSIIQSTLPEIQRIRLSPDKNILVATSKSASGKGVIDKIDISTNSIINTFIFDERNVNPYEIYIIYGEDNTIKTMKYQKGNLGKNNNKELEELTKYIGYDIIKILAKRIISTYEEKIVFKNIEITISSPNRKNEEVRIDEITFQKCIVSEESKHIEYNSYNKDYFILEFNFTIPYYVRCINLQNEIYIVKGKIHGNQKAKLYIPDSIQFQKVDFEISSYTEQIKNPKIINNNLELYVSTLISTKAFIEEEIYVPNLRL